MNDQLKKLKDIHAKCCVSILMNTHRTKPDNKQDPVLLKNLVTQAENRLLQTYDKRFAQPIIDRLKAKAASIRHNFNLDSLALFINDQGIAEYLRMPVKVEDRVVIDQTFATRDIVRAIHQQAAYYVLVLSRDKARLIHAASDAVVAEIGRPFPMDKKNLYTTNKEELTNKLGTDNLIEEFFNRVDKAFHKVWEKNPLPVIVCTEERNYIHYLKVADRKHLVLGHLNRNRLDEKAHHIVPEAWPIVQDVLKRRNDQRLQELRHAVSTGKFLSDPAQIWVAIHEGRGQTLFVQHDYFQPAVISEGQIRLVPVEQANQPGVIDDIIDEMIEAALRTGGDVVFLSKDQLKDFQGLALITRY